MQWWALSHIELVKERERELLENLQQLNEEKIASCKYSTSARRININL